MIKKTALLSAFAALGCGFVYGAPRPETSTYVDGNVTSLKPNTGGTLVFSDDRSMTFRTGVAEIAVPYANIQRAELGATQIRNHDEPAYKVWALPKRLHKTETQLLTLEFKNGLGENQTMTLELAKPAASNVLSTIEERTGSGTASKSAPLTAKTDSKNDWWGDDYWKTNRNENGWGAKPAK